MVIFTGRSYEVILMNKDGLFFSRYKECIENTSGCKVVTKENSHKPSDFTYIIEKGYISA